MFLMITVLSKVSWFLNFFSNNLQSLSSHNSLLPVERVDGSSKSPSQLSTFEVLASGKFLGVLEGLLAVVDVVNHLFNSFFRNGKRRQNCCGATPLLGLFYGDVFTIAGLLSKDLFDCLLVLVL